MQTCSARVSPVLAAAASCTGALREASRAAYNCPFINQRTVLPGNALVTMTVYDSSVLDDSGVPLDSFNPFSTSAEPVVSAMELSSSEEVGESRKFTLHYDLDGVDLKRGRYLFVFAVSESFASNSVRQSPLFYTKISA